MMSPKEQAISDCKYAKSLGELALKSHIKIWTNENIPPEDEYEALYMEAIREIEDNLNTQQCLIK